MYLKFNQKLQEVPVLSKLIMRYMSQTIIIVTLSFCFVCPARAIYEGCAAVYNSQIGGPYPPNEETLAVIRSPTQASFSGFETPSTWNFGYIANGQFFNLSVVGYENLTVDGSGFLIGSNGNGSRKIGRLTDAGILQNGVGLKVDQRRVTLSETERVHFDQIEDKGKGSKTWRIIFN